MKQYNRIMLGSHGKYLKECLEGNFIGCDFDINEDLTDHLTEDWHDFSKQYVPVYMRSLPDKSKTSAGLSCGYLWTICKGLALGDVVLCHNGKGIYHIGIIEGDYYYVPNTNLQHRRKVKWLDKTILRSQMSDSLKHSTGSLGTACDVSKYAEEIEALLADVPFTATAIAATTAAASSPEQVAPAPALPSKYAHYIDMLKAARNLVLTGAPGTGKTFMTKEMAKAMGAEVEFVQFHPSYDYTDFVEGLRPVEKDNGQMGFERKDGAFKAFCKAAWKNLQDSQKSVQELQEEWTFEEKYQTLIGKIENDEITSFKLKSEGKSMEVAKISDFNNIMLKTPGSDSDRLYTVSFDRLSKLSKAFPTLRDLNAISNIADAIRGVINGCHASSYWAVLREVYKQGVDKKSVASSVQRKPFVFIIDEINRGEASKIFGELFYAIDPGYRGKQDTLVKTQYQNLVPENDVFAQGFFVPENVFILATMNDIDRSVESMDFAMRRRFTWLEVQPADTADMLDALPWAAEAKKVMYRLNQKIADTDGLGAAFQLGAAYFLKLKDYEGDFSRLWTLNIEPLLKEYLRGFRKADELLKALYGAYTGASAATLNVNDDLLDEN